MNQKEQDQLDKYEANMRENAIAISNLSFKMEDINPDSAIKALKGIIAYLEESLKDAEK